MTPHSAMLCPTAYANAHIWLQICCLLLLLPQGASGSSIAYNPDLQEGVKDWKVHNGYSGRRAA